MATPMPKRKHNCRMRCISLPGPVVGEPGVNSGIPQLGFDRSTWYLVQCKPHDDRRAVENLRNQGFESFAPICIAERVTRSRIIKRREPLFPGYAFVALNRTRHDWSVIRSTRGVARLVRFGPHPASVPDTIIDGLMRMDGLELQGWLSKLEPGNKVRVIHGPFAGLEVVFEQADGVGRVRVLIDLMKRQVGIQLSAESVVPA